MNMILCVLSSLVALICGSMFAMDKLKADESLRWSQTTAQIQTSTVSYSASAKSQTTYTPKITYRFDYKGRLYGGQTIAFPDPANLSEPDASRFKAMYPAGNRTTVFFDANAPAQSCLEPGDNQGLKYELCWAMGWAAVAAGSALFGKKEY